MRDLKRRSSLRLLGADRDAARLVKHRGGMERDKKGDGDIVQRDSGPFAELVDEKLNQPEAPEEEATAESESPPHPRAVSGDYAEGTAEHDDDREA